MCLGIPAFVLEVREDEKSALVDSNGAIFTVQIGILDEKVKEGDCVIIHAGFAIGKIEREEAEERRRLIEEIMAYGKME